MEWKKLEERPTKSQYYLTLNKHNQEQISYYSTTEGWILRPREYPIAWKEQEGLNK